MLVLSRRANERIVLPGLGVAVQVVSIKPSVVRLGIEAPEDVAVLREELARRVDEGLAQVPEADRSALRHQIHNRLNAMNIGLSLLREQLKAGMSGAAAATVRKIEEEFQILARQLSERCAARAKPPAQTKVRKALLVEDDHNERELLAGFLRLAGIDVATAGDGCAALDYLHTHGRPDVVLLDMVLPRCDGPTTVREIRRDPSFDELAIFALTGHAPERFRLDGRVDGWFQKPLNPEELLARLNQTAPVAP